MAITAFVLECCNRSIIAADNWTAGSSVSVSRFAILLILFGENTPPARHDEVIHSFGSPG
jgi:hypothetical protein